MGPELRPSLLGPGQPWLFLARPVDFLLMTLIKAEIVQKDFGGRGETACDVRVAALTHKVNSQRICGFQCGLKSTFREASEA